MITNLLSHLLTVTLGLGQALLGILDVAEELAVHSLREPEWDIPSLLDAVPVVLVASVVGRCVAALRHSSKGRP